MRLLGPTRNPRLNEVAALVYLATAILITLSLVSYHPQDPSLNTATGKVRPLNLVGYIGSYLSDASFQLFGLPSFLLPALVILLAWTWMQSRPIEAPWVKASGAAMLLLSSCAALGQGPEWRLFERTIPAGGLLGLLLADALLAAMNATGAALFTATCWIVSLYLVSRFSIPALAARLAVVAAFVRQRSPEFGWPTALRIRRPASAPESRRAAKSAAAPIATQPQIEETPDFRAEPPFRPIVAEPEEIPIHVLEDLALATSSTPEPEPPPPPPAVEPPAPRRAPVPQRARPVFHLPLTELLNEPAARNQFDSQELQDTAARIKAKFEEFGVLGSVVQINPGPVVTTFEFKPEAGIKYSRITTLTEDLCLGLQAESILIERIPGKPTVGIEVPNSRSEVISLRQILESDEFHNSPSRLTMSLGKDINGRIRVAALDSMPHLLIAGSTGSGKSVMLNSMIMSVLYKSTPEEVKMILIDPKRLEMGLYEGIPHLLTPVITDPRKATNALRNAVLEMERRLKLLASRGVRNIDQYNRKVRLLMAEPRSLFADEEESDSDDDLTPLPYILILIDELADLMMIERANVEGSVTRLAQMARAVGMHLVVATQRPSVDVITGLIKANFPARVSFRVATRVDSRTVLDVMGAEHLLGKGDMLFLPPGSSRLTRVHGAYVSEGETNRVVEFWKKQANPEYDQTFLLAPPSEDEAGEGESFEGEEDPMYHDAVRVVVEMGKASTSTLQRRLRLGYGRAARILDMMQRDGIIGAPDGSKPREVLKRPTWLEEVVQ